MLQCLTHDAMQYLFTFFRRYPSEREKTQLCSTTKLNGKQVMNWFVNNRKRVWQPMKREQQMTSSAGK